MSLYEKYKVLNKLAYYRSLDINPVEKPECSIEFIKSYYAAGEKEKILIEKDLSGVDAVHTTSVYLLGLVLRNFVEDKLSNIIKEENLFLYVWFMTSLYHDYAKSIENKSRKNNELLKEKKKKVNRLFNTYYNLEINKKYQKYDRELVEKYYSFRAEESKVIDHGIYGGLLLYSDLHDNLKEKMGSSIDNPDAEIRKEGLIWKSSDLKLYHYFADAIIAHNIWHSSDEKLYKKYGLEKLIEVENNKISVNENPLVFFLGLIDSIEPVRYYYKQNKQSSQEYISKESIIEIWKSIDIKLSESNLLLELKILNTNIISREWLTEIEKISNWLNIKVEKYKDDSVKIRIM